MKSCKQTGMSDFIAKATDNKGLSSKSASVAVLIKANKLPAVKLLPHIIMKNSLLPQQFQLMQLLFILAVPPAALSFIMVQRT